MNSVYKDINFDNYDTTKNIIIDNKKIIPTHSNKVTNIQTHIGSNYEPKLSRACLTLLYQIINKNSKVLIINEKGYYIWFHLNCNGNVHLYNTSQLYIDKILNTLNNNKTISTLYDIRVNTVKYLETNYDIILYNIENMNEINNINIYSKYLKFGGFFIIDTQLNIVNNINKLQFKKYNLSNYYIYTFILHKVFNNDDINRNDIINDHIHDSTINDIDNNDKTNNINNNIYASYQQYNAIDMNSHNIYYDILYHYNTEQIIIN